MNDLHTQDWRDPVAVAYERGVRYGTRMALFVATVWMLAGALAIRVLSS